MNAIQASILRDMSEGVITLGMDGRISSVNPASERILARTSGDLLGKSFAQCFFEYTENDAFNQMILDAVYDPDAPHEGVVPYYTGETVRQLHVTTSFLWENKEKTGLIAVLGDVSELTELRDAVKAMERIKALNTQLELRNRLLSETFGRYLSDEIVRQLLDTPEGLALGGKKQNVTVMMSDLRGFTALSEHMEAHSLLSMLNHYLGEMTEIIQSRGGTIIEFIGDGIMAVFGAPVPSETHADDAVAAAVDMQWRMEAVNAWNTGHDFPELEMGIGIHTGDVIVGNIGSEKRTKYGVTGSHVNLCGRIESYTVGGQILISSATKETVTAPLTVAGEQEVFPKGAKVPLILSQVTAVGEPYNVFCSVSDEQPEMLADPMPVSFFTIMDKHCENVSYTGQITALGKSKAVLQTDQVLSPYDNLRLDAQGDLFCKVLEKHMDGYMIHFTAKPPEFQEWLAKMRKTKNERGTSNGTQEF